MPIRVLFPVDALFDISSNRDELFARLLPYVLKQSDESNIVKISKIVSHAFEMNYLETEIIFAFFVDFLSQSTENISEETLKQHI